MNKEQFKKLNKTCRSVARIYYKEFGKKNNLQVRDLKHEAWIATLEAIQTLGSKGEPYHEGFVNVSIRNRMYDLYKNTLRSEKGKEVAEALEEFRPVPTSFENFSCLTNMHDSLQDCDKKIMDNVLVRNMTQTSLASMIRKSPQYVSKRTKEIKERISEICETD